MNQIRFFFFLKNGTLIEENKIVTFCCASLYLETSVQILKEVSEKKINYFGG